jgi:DNA (cytosine-5)-methyltransferase 1
MNHGSLFSGIGGFDLAAEWCGWNNLFHCEWNPFGQKVLKHYWPEAESFNDITKTDFKKYYGTIEVISGGFPCQPYSSAGKRKGKEDERHLWPEMLRAISEIRPRWVVGENVLGLVNWSGGLVFHEVQADLEAEGYEVQPFLLPAAAVGAPHRRDRIWFVAYSASNRKTSDGCGNTNEKRGEAIILPKNKRWQSEAVQSIRLCNMERFDTNSNSNGFNECKWQNFPTQSPVCGGDDGLPAELDGITFPKWRNESIKGYGNAICPQVVYQIFKSIQQYEQL